ncbi:MAG: hypothetical protein NTV63_03400 [Candidatus Woesearchaeota archaeon]|nr:hypothetical protein [Candidatus Woesearchaeota archaeon]
MLTPNKNRALSMPEKAQSGLESILENEAGKNKIPQKEVKAMVISEFPLDSVLGTSKQAKEARKGIIEYVKSEKPDAIFVDGLISFIRFPEIYDTGILESEPIETFMEQPFKLASEFIHELKAASKGFGQIYMMLSDADEDNIRRLTRRTLHDRQKAIAQLINRYKRGIVECENTLKELKKPDDSVLIRQLKGRKAAYQRHLNDAFENKSRIPNSESIDYNAIKEEIFNKYVNTLKSMNRGIEIGTGKVSVAINGYSFLYAHTFNMSSRTPLKSSTNRLLDYLNKLYIGKMPMPDFILEGGHNAEAVAHVYRHHTNDKYSLMVSGMVMEDQERMKDIMDGNYNPELFQGLQSRLAPSKRFAKKLVPSGISILGKNEKGRYFVTFYSMEHLSKVGRKEVNIEDMQYESLNIFSDLHIGKGEVKYDKLKSAVEIMRKEIEERKKENLSSPLLFLVNESLQGRNYKTMSVETKRSIPEEFDEKLKEAIAAGKSMDDIRAMMMNELERVNEPRIMNQLERYNKLINPLVIDTLVNSKYDIGVILNEGTHINHTVGEFGITETGLQTVGIKVLTDGYMQLVKEGLLPYDKSIAEMYKKMKFIEEELSGYMVFETKLGENTYKFSTTHKAGSAKPEQNIPMRLVDRAIVMRDDSDINISGHLHMPFFTVVGRLQSNDISAFYKGATFNEYDSFGKLTGWAPAVIGCVTGIIPINKNGKGVYGAEFVTSDVL